MAAAEGRPWAAAGLLLAAGALKAALQLLRQVGWLGIVPACLPGARLLSARLLARPVCPPACLPARTMRRSAHPVCVPTLPPPLHDLNIHKRCH